MCLCFYRYGAGYYLIIEKQPSCDVLLLTNTIQSIIADAKLTLEFGTEVHFTLPRLSVGYFSKVLDKLEGIVLSHCNLMSLRKFVL